MKTRILLCLTVLAMTLNVQARTMIYYTNPSYENLSNTLQLPDGSAPENASQDDIKALIANFATFLAAWNPEVSKKDAARALIERVHVRGVTNGLIRPALVLIDIGSMSPESKKAAAALLQALQPVAPLTAKEILATCHMSPIQISSPEGLDALQSLRNATIASLNRKYGITSLESITMPNRETSFRDLDSTGMAGIMFGGGSHFRGMQDFIDDTQTAVEKARDRSPIFGFSRNDINQCIAKCGGAVSTGESAGAKIGKYTMGAVGAVTFGAFGTAMAPGGGTAVGVVVGGGAGAAFGDVAGGAVGAAVAWGICSSTNCTTHEAGPATPATAPSEPTPSTQPSGSDSEPKTEAPKSGDEPQTPPASGEESNENCHPGDQTCGQGMGIANDDRDNGGGNGGGKSDTGGSLSGPKESLKHFRTLDSFPSVQPFINPRRDPQVERITGLQSLRGRK